MARVFKISFDRIWGPEDAAPEPNELELTHGNVGDVSTVGARNAEDAIRKLRDAEVGYHDEDDGTYVIGIVIHSVENVGPLDIA